MQSLAWTWSFEVHFSPWVSAINFINGAPRSEEFCPGFDEQNPGWYFSLLYTEQNPERYFYLPFYTLNKIQNVIFLFPSMLWTKPRMLFFSSLVYTEQNPERYFSLPFIALTKPRILFSLPFFTLKKIQNVISTENISALNSADL